jgi:CubicO group peptidase (beta-lactamase class C family)
MKKLLVALILSVQSFVALPQLDTSGFRDFLQQVYTDFELPSMAVAAVKDGQVILSEGFGKRSESQNFSPDGSTQYAIASLSKAFTAASIGMLVDEGKLAWTDPVVKHLPDFKLYDDSVTNVLTIEDLLSHRSGLITFDGDLLWYGTNYSREEVMHRIRYRPLTYALGEKFGYQNIMFITAGQLIERVSGQSWDEFVQKRILDPLKMNRTTSDFQTFYSDLNHASPFIEGKQIFSLSYNNSGATAALNSTTNDMCKWMNFWLNQGVVNGDILLSKESIEKIWEIHANLGVGKFDAENGTTSKAYGMGWFLMDYKGKKVIHHGGGLPGYISKIALVPNDQLGIIVLTNDMSSAPSMLMYAYIDWAAGNDYEQWAAKFLEFKASGEERAEKEKSKRLLTKIENPMMLPLEDYIGLYRDEMYGDARVSMGENGLIFSMLPGKELFTGRMEPWGNHAFKFEHNDPFLTYGIIHFDVQKDVIKGFEIELPNDDFHFDKLNFDKQ